MNQSTHQKQRNGSAFRGIEEYREQNKRRSEFFERGRLQRDFLHTLPSARIADQLSLCKIHGHTYRNGHSPLFCQLNDQLVCGNGWHRLLDFLFC